MAPTASTMVRCGASLSMTATSPNCRSASTSTTGRSLRMARVTPRLQATTLLPAPPLVENTVMTWPSSPVTGAAAAGGGGVDGHDRERLGHAADRIVELGGLDGAESTSRTPTRMARWNSSVVSSLATRTAPTSGRERATGPRRRASPGSSAHDGPSTTTVGVPGSRASRSAIDGNGTACSPSCIANRLRVDWSGSTTATGRDIDAGDTVSGSCPGRGWSEWAG